MSQRLPQSLCWQAPVLHTEPCQLLPCPRTVLGAGQPPAPPAPAPHPHPPSPAPAAGACAGAAPAPGAAGPCSPRLHPLPCPRVGGHGGHSAASKRSACRPPSRRALACGGGGGAGTGPWAAAWAEDGVFPALAHSCRHRSPASQRCMDGSSGRCAAAWALGHVAGAGVHRLPPDRGSRPLPPQHRAALQRAPTHRCPGKKREASGGRRRAAWGTTGTAQAAWRPGTGTADAVPVGGGLAKAAQLPGGRQRYGARPGPRGTESPCAMGIVHRRDSGRPRHS